MTGRHKQNKWRTYIYAKYNSPLSTLTKHLETTRCNHTAFRPVFHSPFNPISTAVGSEVIVKTKQTQLDSFKNRNQEQKPKDKKQDGNVTFPFSSSIICSEHRYCNPAYNLLFVFAAIVSLLSITLFCSSRLYQVQWNVHKNTSGWLKHMWC